MADLPDRTSQDSETPASSSDGLDVDGPGSPGDPLRALLEEALSPEFEIVRSLGEGSMARVWLAREPALGRLVAIKVLRPRLALEEAPRARFLREARSSASIHHPDVMDIHRVGSLPDGTPYLVMEFVDGRTLEDVLQAGGSRPEEEARRILVRVARALQAAHDKGVIHRDVRPGNILTSKDGQRVVLSDFGLAGILETGGEAVTRLTRAGEILGQVRYSAPEQLRGEGLRTESDVYSLAVTAYELLTGRGPYDAEGPARLVEAHLGKDPIPLRTLLPGASQDLEDALLRCLAKRPEHRPRAGDLARRLEGRADAAASAEDLDRGAFRSFLDELKRRHVYQVGAGYAALAYVVLELAGNVLGAFGGSDWLYQAIVLIVLAGFPVTLILTWIYDLTASGIQRTGDGGGAATPGVRALQAGGLALSLAIVALVGWLILR
jgi:serine/threonine protein kinase